MPAPYCLDTDTCIYALRGEFPQIARRMRKTAPLSMAVPSIVRAELLLGAAKSGNPRKAGDRVGAFLLPLRVLDFDAAAADRYAEIRADLEARGLRIGPNDLIVAATVLAHGHTLVTRNTREFRRVKGLNTENWTR